MGQSDNAVALEAESFIAQCERDHKILDSLQNDMVVAYNRNFRVKTIEKILHILSMYAKVHFKREEEFMESSGFHGLQSHIESHKKFIVSLAALKDSFENGEDVYERLRILYTEESQGYNETIDTELMDFARRLSSRTPVTKPSYEGVMPGITPDQAGAVVMSEGIPALSSPIQT